MYEELFDEKEIDDLVDDEVPLVLTAEDLRELRVVGRSYFRKIRSRSKADLLADQYLLQIDSLANQHSSSPETRFDGNGRGLNDNYDGLGLGPEQLSDLIQWYGADVLRKAFPVADAWCREKRDGHKDANSLSMGIFAIIDLVERINVDATKHILSDDVDPVQFLKDPDVGKMNPRGLELYIMSAYQEKAPSMHLNH